MERCCGQATMVHADHVVNSWWGVELLIPPLKHTKYFYFCELSMWCRPMPTRGIDLKSPPQGGYPFSEDPGRGKVRCPDCMQTTQARRQPRHTAAVIFFSISIIIVPLFVTKMTLPHREKGGKGRPGVCCT